MRASEFTTETKRLNPGQWTVDDILAVVPQTQEIWFHGSRAIGKHKRTSDTDILVVVPNDIVGDDYFKILRTLQNLSKQYKGYDIQPTHSNTNIHRIAHEEGKLLYKKEELTEAVQEVTLNDLYHDNYPDQDELIWNYVGKNDFDTQFTVRKINPLDLEEMLCDNYGVDDVQDLFKKMQPEQEDIVSDYQNDPTLSQKIIVTSGRRILDGNHRALAAVLANKPIKYIDVSEEQPEQVDESETPSIGINVRSDGDIDYADLIVDGKKKLETRNTDSLRPYVGHRVAIVRTGRGKAEAIGSVTVGEPIIADEKKFRKLERHHLVPQGSAFDIKPDSTKYLYPMIDPVRFTEPRTVGHGIIARKVF